MAAAPAYLRHIHIPHVIPFSLATSIQNHLFTQNLSYKALLSSTSPSPSTPIPPPPPPTVVTFVPDPVYTLGRREHLSSLSPQQLNLLKSPLNTDRRSPNNPYAQPLFASVIETSRGGQTTFHGPGQIVIYPILDIKSSFPLQSTGFSVRCYVNYLEETTISTLRKWGITGVRTENPGVWEEGGERKIAALGVHLRRNISSYGVGLNISTDLRWFERITACGLEGKGVTSMRQIREEMGLPVDGMTRGERKKAKEMMEGGKVIPLKPNKVVRTWVRDFARGLWGEEAEEEGRIRRVRIEEDEVGLPEEVLIRLVNRKFVEDLDEYYT